MIRLLILILLTTSILSCTRQDDAIDIGLIGVFSGRYSEVGIASRNGTELAVHLINQSGGLLGKKVTTKAIDDKNDRLTLIKAFEEHISEGRRFIIGPNISQMSTETADFALRNDIMIISPTMSADKLAGVDDSFFRVISVTSAEGATLAAQAVKAGFKRAAVIYDISNSEYTKPIFHRFKDKFAEVGRGEIVYTNHVSNSTKEDFINMTSEVVRSDADLLLILTTAIDAAFIAQQIRKVDTDIQLMAARWAKTNDIITNGGKAVEGMILTSMYTPEKRSEKYLDFRKAYIERYNTEPSFVAAYAFEAVNVLAQSIRKAGSEDVAEVKKVLLDTYKFDGLEESFIINKFGDAIRRTSLSVIKDGAFEVLDD